MRGEAARERIASVTELPMEGTFLFRVVPTDAGVDVEREAILIRTDDGDGGDEGGGAEGSDGDGRDRDGSRYGNEAAGHDGVAAWLNYCQYSRG